MAWKRRVLTEFRCVVYHCSSGYFDDLSIFRQAINFYDINKCWYLFVFKNNLILSYLQQYFFGSSYTNSAAY